MSVSKRLNRRIQIQQPSSAQDEYGHPLGEWETVSTVWAEIKDASGREYFAAQASQSEVQTKITIRKRAGVKPEMRVVYGEDIYEIKAVLNQTTRTLLLMCARND